MTNDVFIADQWVEGRGETLSTVCPATNKVVWDGHAASEQQVFDAVSVAKKAFLSWSVTPQTERNEILKSYAQKLKSKSEDIAKAISMDVGKPLWESRLEANAMVGKIAISITALEERSGSRLNETAFGFAKLEHRPHGVMGVLGPFNFPGHLPNGHLVPALLAGNTCVFKPSEEAPNVANIMVEAFKEAGLPSGCLAVVHGGRATGEALLKSDLNGVLFTGSVETGVAFHRQFAGRPEVMLALEMGGNNPLIVWDPCDVEGAANIVFQSAFMTSGQRCSCARRLILPDTKFGDQVIEAVIEQIKSVKIGPWHDEDVFMGPVVSTRAAKQAVAFEKGLIELGGHPIQRLEQRDDDSAFLRPGLIDMTAVDNVPDKELFGPLLQIIRVKSLDEAVKVANQTKFGLASGLVCDDETVWKTVNPLLHAGILNWNRPTTGASSAMPFGGPGQSGNLRPSAYYAADYCAWPQASQIASAAQFSSLPGLK